MELSSRKQGSLGCWTCKVRRKKCDQTLPVCKDCALLEIQCYYSKEKPAWMDGGRGQQIKAESLKKEIKRNAALRRGKNRIRSITRELDGDLDEPDHPTDNPRRPPLRLGEDGCDALPPLINSSTVSAPTPPDSIHLSPCQVDVGWVEPGTGVLHIHNAEPSVDPCQPDFESGLLSSYLDYAFPVLFPFYKPSILDGGRAWILNLALKHPAFYHNIVGLAAYFYCAVPVLSGLAHDACVVKAKTELHVQMEKAVRGVQDSLLGVTRRGIHDSLSENVRLLGNIVQLVNFEAVFASSENWQMHLTAATDLFIQTIGHHGGNHQRSSMMGTMLQKLRGDVPPNCSIFSADQAALRFFSAMVIYQDVIASTVHETTPKILEHYDELLAGQFSVNNSEVLNLEDFIGCHTWVIRSVARISSLNEWKKDAKRKGDLDIMELVQRATLIQKDLYEGIMHLNDADANAPFQTWTNPYRPLEVILAMSNIRTGSNLSQSADHCIISKTWAHAAQVYLTIVLSGWQPGNVQLRHHVAQALELLKQIDNPSWLRTLAWPFCVTGCLATEEEEAAFRDVANASSGLAMFGTLRDALAIMEKVWSHRHQSDSNTWDIAYCLQILGYSVLLV